MSNSEYYKEFIPIKNCFTNANVVTINNDFLISLIKMIFVIFLEHTFVSLTLKLNNMKKLITSVLALTAVAFSYAQNYNEVN